MRRIAWFLLTLLLFLVVGEASAQGRVSVRGYSRKDGTYVRPHTRTAPNGTRNDNWSTQGNVNPITGEAGSKPGDGGSPSGSSAAPGGAGTAADGVWSPTTSTRDPVTRYVRHRMNVLSCPGQCAVRRVLEGGSRVSLVHLQAA